MIRFELSFMKSVRSAFRFFYVWVCVCLVVWAALVENTILLPFYCPLSSARGHLTVSVWVYVWALFSSLPCLSVLSPVPPCLGYCNFTVRVGRALSAFQVFLLQHCSGYSGSFPLHIYFESVCWSTSVIFSNCLFFLHENSCFCSYQKCWT